MQRANLTDRAKRYRAQHNVTGPRKCVLCGGRSDIQVMHLSGNENDGERANLAYGCRSCNGKLSAAFKAVGAGRPTNQYNPSDGVPTFEQYMWAVSNHSRGAHDAGGAIIHATPKHKRIEYARRIVAKAQTTKRARFEDRWNAAAKPKGKPNPWPFSKPDARRTTPASGGIAYHMGKAGKRPAVAKAKKTSSSVASVPTFEQLEAGYRKGLSLREMLQQNPSFGSGKTVAERMKWLEAEARRILLTPAKYKPDEVAWAKLMMRNKRNPAAASAEVFEEFHGFEPSEVVTVTKHVHHHEHLAAAGKLTHLDVYGVDDQGHKLTGFKGALLAFNEAKNQLFVEGGDQSINLDDFGISAPHEMETLGKVTDIGYQTNKTHLGDEGGEAVYIHKFRSTNKAGRHVIVKIAREPDLIYDVRNEQLLFSGGSYEILREGIDR